MACSSPISNGKPFKTIFYMAVKLDIVNPFEATRFYSRAEILTQSGNDLLPVPWRHRTALGQESSIQPEA